MPPYQLDNPLQRYPVFETSNSEEFRSAILTKFGGTKFEVDNSVAFKARGNLIDLKDISLVHGACNTSVSVDYPEADYFRLLMVTAGHGKATIGGDTTAIHEQQSSIVSPACNVRIQGEGRHGWLTLRVRARALERRLTSSLGFKPKGKLEFAPSTNNDQPKVDALRQLIMFLAEQLDSTAVRFPPTVLRSLEQSITTAFLYANRHTFSDVLEREPNSAAPRQVRLAEEYIEANWDQPVNIEELVAVTNLGSRSLFRSFKRYRGNSPIAFAKHLKLRHANEMLRAGTPGTTVTAVALRCGFANLGHFAKEYQDNFGEKPSETLARARRIDQH